MSFTAGKPHSFTVDHVIPRSKGGSNALRNTVAACHACNQAKGSMTADQFTI
jgi:5-methylcytosine-specific restriction endonuclease McrA